jgi:hypothetical protein
VTLELPFTYPLLYNPSFSTLRASFAQFSFGEKEESPRVRVYLWFSREERILSEFSKFFIPLKFVKWEKIFQVLKLKLLTHFSDTRHSLIKLQTFSFIEPHETQFFITDCKNLFSPKSHEIHIGIEWDMFLHDPKWKSYHMNSCLIFQFLVKFSSLVHDFGCSAILSSLWVYALAQLKITWGSGFKYKTYQNAQTRFQKVFITCNFQAIFLWHFTLPNHWEMADLRKLIKWLLPIQIQFCQLLWVLWDKNNALEKTHFYIFGPTGCDPSTSSLVVDQIIQITISWFLPIRFEKWR